MSDVSESRSGALVSRRAERLVEDATMDTRVILLNGARQSGKSTLARQVARHHDAIWTSFDNPQTLSAARSDPLDFVRSERMTVIDEVQRYPEILLPIKLQVDEDPRPGAFLLTGSAHVMGLRSVPDTLPGRVETIELWPLSQGEMDSAPDGFVDAVFQDMSALAVTSTLTKADYAERIARGGFPESVARTGRRREVFLRNYVADLVNREVTQVAEVEHGPAFHQLIRLAATRSGELLVPANLAQTTGLSKTTVSRYLAIMHEVFLVKILPAWASGSVGRAIKTPKLAFVDSGVATHLLGHNAHSLLRPGAPFGPLLEGFAAMELARQATWSLTHVNLFHYRSKDKQEVDLVLLNSLGQIVGLEIKASTTARGEDFNGLKHLAARTGSDFLGGILLYAGTTTMSFGDRFKAMPLSSIWQVGGLV